jgi:hypothetical protein
LVAMLELRESKLFTQLYRSGVKVRGLEKRKPKTEFKSSIATRYALFDIQIF